MVPRVFLVRHGETEWSRSGQYTGITEKELTLKGEQEAFSVAQRFVGHGKLIDPSHLVRIFVSPRVRARKTFELIMSNTTELRENVVYSDDVREWDHGEYEGMTTQDIRALRAEKGLDKTSEWSIWTGGCEGGESAQDVTNRVNSVISSIQEIQKSYVNGQKPADVLIVGHGTFLRCLVKIWGGLSIDSPLDITLETGSVAVLSYKDNNMSKRTLVIGHKNP